MEIKKMSGKLSEFLKKYRYAILVLLIGIVMMNIPQKSTKTSAQKDQIIVSQPQMDVETRLVKVLETIEGVGRVEVMLTEACGAENVYQSDTEMDKSESGSSEHRETVIMTDSDRNEAALVVKVKSPQYLGAVIVCEGAESSSVRLSIVDAVSKITGLKSDCISVLKMK